MKLLKDPFPTVISVDSKPVTLSSKVTVIVIGVVVVGEITDELIIGVGDVVSYVILN